MAGLLIDLDLPLPPLQLERIGQVSGPCVEELKRVEKQRAEDVRLDRTLFRACSADVRRFCKDEEWGETWGGIQGAGAVWEAGVRVWAEQGPLCPVSHP